jgi:peptide-methionine (R)-S-oxide reductase
MTQFSRRALLTTAGAVAMTACSPGPAGADERQYANSPFRRITDAQWRERLPRAAYDVLRHEATERPGSSRAEQ